MIDLRNKAEHKEVLERFISDHEEITGFYNIDELHIAIHQFKIDHPDKKGYAKFNDFYFFTDDPDLTADALYIAITGQSKTERKKQQEQSYLQARIREQEEKMFTCHKISSFIKEGLAILEKEHWEEWIDLVPVRAMDMYRTFDLECFLELHNIITESTFEHAKEVFKAQGHSGFSASIVFQMLEKFSPNGKRFMQYMGYKRCRH